MLFKKTNKYIINKKAYINKDIQLIKQEDRK